MASSAAKASSVGVYFMVELFLVLVGGRMNDLGNRFLDRAHPIRRRQRDIQDCQPQRPDPGLDRKSTRLNSSHMSISYAVFCLKKKKKKKTKTLNKQKKTTILITK